MTPERITERVSKLEEQLVGECREVEKALRVLWRRVNKLARKLRAASLSEREHFVLTRRYGASEMLKLDEIADALGISRERVRQIERVAFSKVAHAMLLHEPDEEQ